MSILNPNGAYIPGESGSRKGIEGKRRRPRKSTARREIWGTAGLKTEVEKRIKTRERLALKEGGGRGRTVCDMQEV